MGITEADAVIQLETLGMVYVPTCLVGPGLVRHSLVPDLLGPALAHHGLEPGIASLRASLDHLRVGLGPCLDHHGLDPGIYWRFQRRVCRGLYQRVLPHLQGFQCLGGCCHPADLLMFSRGSNSKLILRKFTRKLIYLAADLFLPNSPRSSLSTQTIQTESING
jgi:hypothetical protein